MAYARHFRRGVGVLLLISLMVMALPLGAWAKTGNPQAKPGKPSQPQYGIIVDRDVSIPLRDGVVLKADIYRPDAKGKFPVLVEGTPYNKDSSSEKRAQTDTFFVPRGYVFITYDVRGQFKSGGDFKFHEDDMNDTYDVIEWAAKQPWSNGKVAMVGISYPSQVVMNAAGSKAPHLVAGIPALTGHDLWKDWYYHGGAMEEGFLVSWPVYWIPIWAEKHLQGKEKEEVIDEASLYWADPAQFVDILPLSDYKFGKVGEYDPFSQWINNPSAGEFYDKISPKSWIDQIQVPLLHVAGWYDIFQDGTIKNFTETTKRGGNALARDNQRLIIGPWAHYDEGFFQQTQGVVDQGKNLTAPPHGYNEMRLDFLDYWMKDLQHGTMMDLENPVQIWVQGPNEWRNEPAWPLERAEEVVMYLNGGKSGTIDSVFDGTLTLEQPAKEQTPQTFVYDPMNAMPTRGGALLFSFPYGPDGIPGNEGVNQSQQVQNPVDKRSLTFTSAPLTEEMEITGKVLGKLFASSDAVDTDWVIRVNDVAPDGTSLNVVEGIQRARYRDSDTDPTLIEPGKIYDYDVDLWSNSYVFKPGHRIRVVVNSSNFPRWSRNMNVAEQPEKAKDYKVANNTVYMDKEHPSHIVLPVVPKTTKNAKNANKK